MKRENIFGRATSFLSLLLFVLLLLVGFALANQSALPARAATPIYVRSDGSDANCDGTVNVADDGSGHCAKATIGAGIMVVDTGGEVRVAQGTYSETLLITKSLTLMGDPGGSAPGPGANAPTLNGSSFSGKSAIEIAAGVSNVSVQGFIFENYALSNKERVQLSRASKTAVARDFSKPIDVNPDLLMLTANRASAIQAWNAGTSNITIQYNRFQNLGWNAVLVGNEGQGVHDNWNVSHNVVAQAAAYGIELTNASNSVISDNEITFSSSNWSAGIFVNSYNFLGTTTSVISNSIRGNTINNAGSTPGTAIVVTAWQTGTGSSASLNSINIEDNRISGGGGAVMAYPSGGASIGNVRVKANAITITNPAGSAWYGPYAIYGRSWEQTGNAIENNTILITGTLGSVISYYHGINVSGGTSARNGIDITANRLEGGGAFARRALDNRQTRQIEASVASAGILFDNDLPSSAGINIRSNSISGFQNGIRVGTVPGGVDFAIHYNRIVDNAWGGVANNALNADNNWWGCNAGPGAAGCDPLTSTLVYTPWLVLGLSASPPTLSTGGTSTLNADLNHNSTGADISSQGFAPNGIPAVFAANIGAVAPTITQTLSGTAKSILSAGSVVGTGVISVTIDHQTVTQTITVVPNAYLLYLPLIMKNYQNISGPDLVVSNVSATASGVLVRIENQGDQAVEKSEDNEFWVDFYVAPSPAPVAVNQVWNDGRSTYGVAWGVTQDALPIQPGGVLTLTYSTAPGAPNLYYFSDLSNFPSALAAGTAVYAQVDSYNALTNYGAVLETHEASGDAYNNILAAQSH